MERLFQEKRFARRYCIVFILHVQEHLYRGRVDQLLLCMAVLRYPLWHSPYVRMACIIHTPKMICHNSEMKKQSGFEVLKAGTQTVGKDYPRPGFLMGTAIKCYAVERHF